MPQTISLTFSNLVSYISLLAPLLISFFMIMYSILTNNVVKGLIFCTGLVIITVIVVILKNLLKDTTPQGKESIVNPICNLLSFPFKVQNGTLIYRSPSLSSSIIGFVIGFLVFPMYTNNNMNYQLLIALFAVLVMNMSVETQYICTSSFGSILGAIVGMLFGIVYYTMLVVSGNQNLAYFAKFNSNNTQCRMAGSNTFRCRARGAIGSTSNNQPDPASSVDE
jgi:hypothetical protein